MHFCLLLLKFYLQLFNLVSEVLGEFLDLTLDIKLEPSSFAPVLHSDALIRLFSNEE